MALSKGFKGLVVLCVLFAVALAVSLVVWRHRVNCYAAWKRRELENEQLEELEKMREQVKVLEEKKAMEEGRTTYG